MGINEIEQFFKGEEGLDNPECKLEASNTESTKAEYVTKKPVYIMPGESVSYNPDIEYPVMIGSTEGTGPNNYMGNGGNGSTGKFPKTYPEAGTGIEYMTRIPAPEFKPIYTVSGGMLTGKAILDEIKAGRIMMSPFDETKINPNSYNLTLNNTLLMYKDDVLDYKKENPTSKVIIPDSGLILYPGKLYLGSTNEETYTNHYIPVLNGRSSIGRLGITIHITAGFGDIGWKGKWTLEISVVKKVKVYPNMEICQQSWFVPAGDTDIQYAGRYQNQEEVTASRSNLDKHIYTMGE